MSTVICLGGGIEGLPILQRAKAMGHQLVVVDGNPAAPGFALADRAVLASCYDVVATVEALKAFWPPALPRPDGVLCCAIDAPDVAAGVAARFGLPGLRGDVAALSADKVAQKTVLRAAGLPVPDFVASGDVARYLGPAVVVKPVDSRGARGVQVVSGFEPGGMLPAAMGPALADAKAASPTGRAMYEQYIPGTQLSTESIVQDGRVLFTLIGVRNYVRFAAGEFGPHPVEDGFDAPTPAWWVTFGDPHVSQPLAQAVDVLLAKACRVLGWDNLTVKGDWIIDNYGKLHILELAARLSGGFFGSHGAPLAHGVDLVGAAVRLALGERVESTADGFIYPASKQYVCQRYVFPDAGDVGRRVVSVPFLVHYHIAGGKDSPAVEQWGLTAEPPKLDARGFHLPRTTWLAGAQHATYAIHAGDTIRAVTDHGARWGQVICTGATADEARARAEAAVVAMKAEVVLE